MDNREFRSLQSRNNIINSTLFVFILAGLATSLYFAWDMYMDTRDNLRIIVTRFWDFDMKKSADSSIIEKIIREKIKKSLPARINKGIMRHVYVKTYDDALDVYNKTGKRVDIVISGEVNEPAGKGKKNTCKIFIMDGGFKDTYRDLKQLREFKVAEIEKNMQVISFAFTSEKDLSEGLNWLYALALYKKHNYETAIKYLKDVYTAPAYFYRGNCYFLLGMKGAAIQNYETAIEKDDLFSDAYANLAVLYDVSGFYRQAQYYAAGALLIDNKNFYGYYTLGLIFLENENYELAENILKQAAGIKPDSAGVFIDLGIACEKQKKYNEALAFLSKARRLNKKDPDVYYQAGVVYKEMKKYKKALKYLGIAISIEPEHAKALNTAGDIFEEQDKNETAVKFYELALKAEPDFEPAYINLGLIYKKMRQYDKAIAFLSKIIKIKPGLAQAYHDLGLVYQEMGDDKTAVELYNRVLELLPGSYETYNNLGMIYGSMGKYDEAIDCFKKAIGLSAEPYDSYYRLGIISEMAERKDDAVYFYEKALAIKPDLYQAAMSLAGIYDKQAIYFYAIRYYNMALDGEKNDKKMEIYRELNRIFKILFLLYAK